MKFVVYCNIVVNDENTPTQMAGCGIVLILNVDGHIKRRDLSFALGGSDSELSSIQCLRLALTSIIPSFRKHPLEVHVNDRKAVDLLVRSGDEFVNMSARYFNQVSDMRRLFVQYPDVNFILEINDYDDYMRDACRLANTVVKSQKNTDSGTFDVL